MNVVRCVLIVGLPSVRFKSQQQRPVQRSQAEAVPAQSGNQRPVQKCVFCFISL